MQSAIFMTQHGREILQCVADIHDYEDEYFLKYRYSRDEYEWMIRAKCDFIVELYESLIESYWQETQQVHEMMISQGHDPSEIIHDSVVVKTYPSPHEIFSMLAGCSFASEYLSLERLVTIEEEATERYEP